jgi:uncharacterized protein
MLGTLTDAQIDNILLSQMIGRIGCCADNKMYVVPVSYVFHDGYIYAHSKEGLKLEIMRKNPDVCFQVDAIENMANWRSVIVWGTYEEIKDVGEQQAALKILVDKFHPFMTSETVRPSHGDSLPPTRIEKGLKAQAYRIRIREKTGRFEKLAGSIS